MRAPNDARGRIEVRPRSTPNLKAWEELPDRSLTFLRPRAAPPGPLVLPGGAGGRRRERSKTVVHTEQRDRLPHWFKALSGRMRRKEAVKLTRGTDANALVVLVPAGDHAEMIRLFFATKVWILKEGIVLPPR